jgi:hypothetical protein
MRLDKFVGKALYSVEVYVCDCVTNTQIFYLSNGELFSDLEEEMKNYKVKYFEIKDNKLYVGVKERKNG